eukprot:jgi/Botrbrau1/12663/Bobra.67_1s0028.1
MLRTPLWECFLRPRGKGIWLEARQAVRFRQGLDPCGTHCWTVGVCANLNYPWRFWIDFSCDSGVKFTIGRVSDCRVRNWSRLAGAGER